MLCIGHRGAMGHAPENTLLSMEKALELGVPWIELDVYEVEGRLIVIHDDTLERTTNGAGYVPDQTFEYLRSLDAGKGQKIPTLDEVFDLVQQRAGINIELKGPDTAEPVALFIDKHRLRGWTDEEILVSSFHHRELRKIKGLDNQIRIGLLISKIPDKYAALAEEMGAFSVHVSLKHIKRAFVQDAHRRGLKVYVYTVNQPDDIERMRSLGVDGVFTNYPERVMKGKLNE
jgi:glycerophosphoryl diester phosphodiesterase